MDSSSFGRWFTFHTAYQMPNPSHNRQSEPEPPVVALDALLMDDILRGLEDIANGRTQDAETALRVIEQRRKTTALAATPDKS
jgi:hypothetical protein